MNKKFKFSFFNVYFNDTHKNFYLYNTYSGALGKFTKTIYDEIFSGNVYGIPEDVRQKMIREGFLVPSKVCEINKIKYNELESVYSKGDILSFVIAPTLKCNFCCRYCFEKGRRQDFQFEEADLCRFVFAQIRKFKPKKLIISWFGGEPMLEFAKIVRLSEIIMNFCDKYNILYEAKMISNGSLLTEERIVELVDKCSLKNIQITLDGNKETYCKQKGVKEDVFERVINNIVKASSHIKINIRLNCDFKNYISLKNVVKDLINEHKSSLNLRNIHFYLAKVMNYEKTNNDTQAENTKFEILKDDFNNYLNELIGDNKKSKLSVHSRNVFCGLRKITSFVIGPSGELYKCEHDIGDKKCVIGDINNGYYYNDYMLNFLNKSLKKECLKCKLLPICVGGCPANGNVSLCGYDCCMSEEALILQLKKYLKID